MSESDHSRHAYLLLISGVLFHRGIGSAETCDAVADEILTAVESFDGTDVPELKDNQT